MGEARTKRELFINVLDMWLGAEISLIGETSINITEEKENVRKMYDELIREYDLKGE